MSSLPLLSIEVGSTRIFGGILDLHAMEKEHNVPNKPITEAWRSIEVIYKVVQGNHSRSEGSLGRVGNIDFAYWDYLHITQKIPSLF